MENRPCILVSGCCGFLGIHVLARGLLARAKVVGFDLSTTHGRARDALATFNLNDFNFQSADAFDAKAIRALIEEHRPTIVIHLVGSTRRDSSPEAWLECARLNVNTVAAIIAAISQTEASRRPVLVIPGTQMEYGSTPGPWTESMRATPIHAYGATKLAVTEMALAAFRQGGLKGCVMRMPIVFGQAQPPVMLIPEVICNALQNKPICTTSGLQRRRFLFADDAADLLIGAGLKLCRGEMVTPLFNAPCYEPLRILDLVKNICSCFGSSVDLQIGALPDREGELADAWPDTTLADSMKWFPLTPLNEALKTTTDWYREHAWFWNAQAPSPSGVVK